jgi:hypothetical protein
MHGHDAARKFLRFNRDYNTTDERLSHRAFDKVNAGRISMA